jgi:dihydropteroate synthase
VARGYHEVVNAATQLWRCGPAVIPYGARTRVVGIVNVTPDSFSDGGRFLDPAAAVERGREMIEDGADLLDVGGESTRPGSEPVPAADEILRVVPVIERLAAETDVPISVDTRKAEVAGAAIEAGAVIVNDVSAGSDPAMFGTVSEAGCGLVLMHMRGDPATMQTDPRYDDVVAEVHDYLRGRVDHAMDAGVERDRICVDPGIGFGKTLEHNLLLLRHVRTLLDLDLPVLVGPSRKRFIGSLTGGDVGDRLEGTAGAVAWLAGNGVHLVRVHDVREMARVLRVVDAIAHAGDGS